MVSYEIDGEEGINDWGQEEEMALHRELQSSRHLSLTEANRTRRRQTTMRLFALLAFLLCLFLAASNGFEIFGTKINIFSFADGTLDDASSKKKGQGPLPTNDMSPSTQQWYKAVDKVVKPKNDTSTVPGSCADTTKSNVVVLDPKTLLRGIEQDVFDVILDVRTTSEWHHKGHIPNATLMENLANDSMDDIISKMGGTFCLNNTFGATAVVYCSDGKRASRAINRLIDAGFCGLLIDGQGTKQWETAGLALVYTDSALPNCL